MKPAKDWGRFRGSENEIMNIDIRLGIAVLAFFAAGIVFGWVWRSFQFGLDEDCANPKHREKESE